MSLDPHITTFLTKYGIDPAEIADSDSYDKDGVTALKHRYRGMMSCLPLIDQDNFSYEEVSISNFWLRIYRPISPDAFKEPPSVVFFFHGGPGRAGTLATHHALASQIAAHNMVVISIDWAQDKATITQACERVASAFNHIHDLIFFHTRVSPKLTVIGVETGALMAAGVVDTLTTLTQTTYCDDEPWSLQGVLLIDPVTSDMIVDTPSLLPIPAFIPLLREWYENLSTVEELTSANIDETYQKLAKAAVPVCILSGGLSPMGPGALRLTEDLQAASETSVIGIIYDGVGGDFLLMEADTLLIKAVQASAMAVIKEVANRPFPPVD